MNCNIPYQQNYQFYPTWIQQTKTIKRVTKTIEKYGPTGEYLGKEIITEDRENIEVPDLSQPWTPELPYTGDLPYNGTITVSNTGNLVAYTYTQN